MVRAIRTLGTLIVGLGLSAPQVCFAQNASSAQALFEDGRRLMQEGKFGDACPKLAASQRLDPAAGTLMNLASCYDKNGQTASAWAAFKEAASAARANHPDWETAARARAAELEPNLSRLTIVVSPEADVPGLVIERDGQPVDRAEWGVALPIDPGVHPVEARAPQKQRWSTTASVAPNGGRASVSVPALAIEQGSEAPTGPAMPLATQPESAGAGGTQRLLGLGAAGVGVVGLGVGTIFGLMAKSTHDDALTHCTADRRCDREGIDLGDKASSQATVSTVFFATGGVLLAAGAVLYFTAPSSHGASAAFFIAPSNGAATPITGLRGVW